MVENVTWARYYDTWGNAGKNSFQAFVLGGAAFLNALGVGKGFALTMMAVLVISFAATTLDTATRIQRFILTELGASLQVRPLQNRYFATALALVPAGLLIFVPMHEPGSTSQATKPVASILWPIFGASNQMLAALTLMVLSLYFWQRKRPILPLLIPMLIVMVITIWALFLKTSDFLNAGNYLLVGLNCLLLALILWMILEGIGIVSRIRRAGPSAGGPV